MRWPALLAPAILAGACSFDPPQPIDLTDKDAGSGPVTRDGGVASVRDAGALRDAGDEVDPADAGANDAGSRDGGPATRDAGAARDAGNVVDAGPPFIPSNAIPADLIYESTIAFSLNERAVMNTDDGSIVGETSGTIRAAGAGLDPTSGIGFTSVPQTDLPPIGVFTFGSFEVQASARLRVRGAGPVALVTSGDVVLDGVIDVSGGRNACVVGPVLETCAGPGGRPGGDYLNPCCGQCLFGGRCDPPECPMTCSCPDPSNHVGDGKGGSTGDGLCFSEAGGGGGGFGTAGGRGGNADTNGNGTPGGVVTPGGAAGAAWGDRTLVPLHGGGGGGAGAPEDNPIGPGLGGGGGGAIQIVSGGVFRVGPTNRCGIDAGGAGGGPAAISEAGGGGGAGGGILIEALDVEIASGCFLAANGGAGSSAHDSMEGASGGLTALPAQPSQPVECGGGFGGEGGARNGSVTDGQDCPIDCGAGILFCAGTGGGGGGVGRIRINADSSTVLGTTSPVHSNGTLAR